MTAEEIALMAQHNEPMPESFSLAEQLLYKSIRLTYESFRRGLIDRKQGAKEKQAAMTRFGIVQLQERVYRECAKRAVEIGKLLAEANKCGCETCRKIADTYTGIQRRINDKQE